MTAMKDRRDKKEPARMVGVLRPVKDFKSMNEAEQEAWLDKVSSAITGTRGEGRVSPRA